MSTYTPPRLLILASPAGIYLTITLSPDTGWTGSAAIGAAVFVLILFGPAMLRASAKAAAVRAATKKAEAAAKKEKEGKKK
ncbi:hypothetical protein [Streptomyces sp. NPDC053541]|uniref:hypothetical protein n=1 Tax=Streptomyces sp. NPDC053541 TaxID=3365709 RepID=UPI0037CFA1B2